MKYLLLVFIAITLSLCLSAKETITFKASDGLTVTADLYEVEKGNPYILFFHQAGSSRGEFKEIARKFLNLGYNSLVVDLRSGEESQFVANETAAAAKREGKPATFTDAEKDILAAIEYAWARNNKQMVLFGSSYSASLCLKVAKNNDKVSAVVAFSPGEFLKPHYNVQEGLAGFDKPVLAACSQREFKYLEEMFSGIKSSSIKLFSPKNGPGEHGAKSLWSECKESREYWWELNLFFQKLKKS